MSSPLLWLFVLVLVLAGYILIGWPLLLALLARFRARPIEKQFVPRTVTGVIAVHNGAGFLRAKLDSLYALDYPQELLDVIVVSDGSTDETDAIVTADKRAQLVRVPRGGKCLALNAGAVQATGEILFLTDVRQTLDPQCLRYLVACFADSTVGVVSGDLKIRAGDSVSAGDVSLYRRFETWIRDRLSQVDSMFGATGSIYTIRRELFVPMPENILLDDMFLPLSAFFKGYRLVMEDSAVAWDVPTSVEAEFGRKVRTLAGNYQLLQHYPELILPMRNRMWLHFMSYKMGRLILPWLLAIVLVLSFFLPEPWMAAALTLQGLFYGLVVLDPALMRGNPLKKISSPARTFTVMMLAAACAVRIFWTDPRKLWVVTLANKKA